jgi:hypothetical protein
MNDSDPEDLPEPGDPAWGDEIYSSAWFRPCNGNFLFNLDLRGFRYKVIMGDIYGDRQGVWREVPRVVCEDERLSEDDPIAIRLRKHVQPLVERGTPTRF